VLSLSLQYDQIRPIKNLSASGGAENVPKD